MAKGVNVIRHDNEGPHATALVFEIKQRFPDDLTHRWFAQNTAPLAVIEVRIQFRKMLPLKAFPCFLGRGGKPAAH